MKVAVTAEDRRISSRIDPRFGRARWFVIVDTDTGDAQAHDNRQTPQVQHGAGIQAAQRLASLGVRAVITGNVGPKAFDALKAAGIEIYLTYAGTVSGAVERLGARRISPATRPSNRGHRS